MRTPARVSFIKPTPGASRCSDETSVGAPSCPRAGGRSEATWASSISESRMRFGYAILRVRSEDRYPRARERKVSPPGCRLYKHHQPGTSGCSGDYRLCYYKPGELPGRAQLARKYQVFLLVRDMMRAQRDRYLEAPGRKNTFQASPNTLTSRAAIISV
jgi:hypothetical protein